MTFKLTLQLNSLALFLLLVVFSQVPTAWVQRQAFEPGGVRVSDRLLASSAGQGQVCGVASARKGQHRVPRALPPLLITACADRLPPLMRNIKETVATQKP